VIHYIMKDDRCLRAGDSIPKGREAMYTHSYLCLRLAEERVKEGLRKAEWDRHVQAAADIGKDDRKESSTPLIQGSLLRHVAQEQSS
jgi:hypothetical protein